MMLSGLSGRASMASRAPWLHEQEARAQGLALQYELFDFTARGLGDDSLGGIIETLRNHAYCGFNVTYPFKQQILPLLDALDTSAEIVGAVNTVAIREGRMIGYNTDMSGFHQSVVEGLAGAAMARVLQLGAGGAGAAVASALLRLGVERLDVVDIDTERARALAETLGRRFGGDRVRARADGDRATGTVDGIVNATPVGLAANPGMPIDPALIDPRHWVADIVYFPLETELLRVARSRGCRTLDGSGMVINQAAAAFEIITGSPANRQRMRTSFFV